MLLIETEEENHMNTERENTERENTETNLRFYKME